MLIAWPPIAPQTSGMSKLRWGILSTGRIAHRLASALKTSKTGTLTAVASRDLGKAQAFAKEFPGATAYGSYDDLLADANVDAVYIATPHPAHAKWAIRAARAGKHILCEKPAAMNEAEVQAILDAVKEHGVFFLEAFMYRCHPQTAQLVELIRSGAIGQVQLIECSFAFNAGYDPNSRLFANALGGGGLLDVGCYCVSMARLLAGAATGQDSAEPIRVKAVGRLDEREGTDLYTSAVLEFPGNILANLFTAVQVNHDNHVRVFGSEGRITVTQPWFAGSKGAKIIVQKNGAKPQELKTESKLDLYGYEIDLVEKYHTAGQVPSPAMTHADTLGNARVIDAWRQEIGLVYQAEKPTNLLQPIWGDALEGRKGARVEAAPFPGLTKPMSRLVMGGMSARTLAGQMVLDDYFERGGNAFDTAFIYGSADEALGHWMKSRGVREDVVLIAKGAHTPNCTPEGLTRELFASLEKLQTDRAELYIMHRDNLEVPVGEFVTVLNEHLRAGRFQAFGGSNWTIERIEEANAYAAANGLIGFSVLNNQMSLARMVDPIWAGCLSVSDPESRAWLERNQFPVLAWSSQARGFFTDRSPDEELTRCWFAPDNFERKKRAAELARKKGVEEINVALAYVLTQPFPVWTLIGPATCGEVRSSLRALKVELTLAERQWLNLEIETLG